MTIANLLLAVKRSRHWEEGTTKGDPIATVLCALSIQPLCTGLQVRSTAKQCWFANDAGGAGSTTEIKRWWDMLSTLGPDFGYFLNAKKCWIIASGTRKKVWKKYLRTQTLIWQWKGRTIKERRSAHERNSSMRCPSHVLIHIFAYHYPKMGTN